MAALTTTVMPLTGGEIEYAAAAGGGDRADPTMHRRPAWARIAPPPAAPRGRTLAGASRSRPAPP